MSRFLSLENPYLLNRSLLIVHEIDSAFWKEWELFGIPGGIQLFLLLNFLLVLLFLDGYRCVIQKRPRGIVFSWLLIASGFIVAGLHGYFLATGFPRFNLPASLINIATIVVGSTARMIIMVTQTAGNNRTSS